MRVCEGFTRKFTRHGFTPTYFAASAEAALGTADAFCMLHMIDHSTIGGRLRSFRQHKKLSGDELGAILGVGKARVSGIEHNTWGPTFEGLLRLSAAFPDLDLNWLVTGKGEMLLVWERERRHLLALLQAEQAQLQEEKQKHEEAKVRLQAAKEQLEAARSKAEALEELLLRHGINVSKHKGGTSK